MRSGGGRGVGVTREEVKREDVTGEGVRGEDVRGDIATGVGVTMEEFLSEMQVTRIRQQ